MTSAGNKLFTVFGGGPSLDPAVAAFKATTGATDTAGLDALIRYVRGEGLLPYFVIYPMKSAQNYGTGANVAPLGGITAGDLVLTNSPTWGASGLVFNGTTQYAATAAAIAAVNAATSLTVWNRRKPTSASAVDGAARAFWCVGRTNPGSTGRGVFELFNTGSLAGETHGLGANALFVTYRQGSDNFTWSADEDHTSVITQTASGVTMQKNKTAITLNKFTVPHSASTDTRPVTMGVTQSFVLAATINDSGTVETFGSMTGVAHAFCTAALTSTQRDVITDLINAL